MFHPTGDQPQAETGLPRTNHLSDLLCGSYPDTRPKALGRYWAQHYGPQYLYCALLDYHRLNLLSSWGIGSDLYLLILNHQPSPHKPPRGRGAKSAKMVNTKGLLYFIPAGDASKTTDQRRRQSPKRQTKCRSLNQK